MLLCSIKSIDTLTARKSFTPVNHLFIWGNLLYGDKRQIGLFAGYAKNLGADDQTCGIFYGRGMNIDYVYRLSSSLSYISKKTQFSIEFEYTVAAYGTTDNEGIVNNAKEIGGSRILFTVFYFF